MNIAFDAKRAFHNGTGLGHYSRTLIRSLAAYYPENDYYLFNPKPSRRFNMKGEHLLEIRPGRFIDRLFPAYWRSYSATRDLRRLHIQLYHGLSHEITWGINKAGIPSVVTIHDLIHERYPEQYARADVMIYRNKFRHACVHSSLIIAVSEQTKRDIVQYYHIPENKIRVTYQSCDPAFARKVEQQECKRVRETYGLPDAYFLYVGSVIERKNLLGLCRALNSIRKETDIPLVVIGDGDSYKKKVKAYLKENELEQRVLFLSEQPAARASAAFQTASDFPAIYQMAKALIYPSLFEGFGIPVLEALWSGIPVITSNSSCLPEVGGEGALYVDPLDSGQLASAMKELLLNAELRESLVRKGLQQAQLFTAQACADRVMSVYREIG